MKVLCGDALFWMEHGTYPPAEMAVRFKHRIVGIHCFPNGHGSHSRPIADIIIEKLFWEVLFSWGADDATRTADTRSIYLKAIKAADKGDFTLLMKCVRTYPLRVFPSHFNLVGRSHGRSRRNTCSGIFSRGFTSRDESFIRLC
jgi:fido (protein-threonine AMPylation protein)